MASTTLSLLVIAVVAAIAPVLADALPRVRVPVVVVEIVLGIVVGPQLLGLVTVSPLITALSQFGLAFLFFLAGFEIDFERIRGRPLRLGLGGWLLSLVFAFALAGVLHLAGLVQAVEYVALATATTALGTLLPILRDAGEMETRFGTFFQAIGAVGEFGPIVLIALLLDQERRVLASALVLNLFVLLVIAGVVVARRWHPPRVARLVKQTMRSSAQLAVRLSVVLLIAFVFLSIQLGLEFLLGAFGAGIIAAQVVKTVEADDPADVEVLRIKYEGVGFGYLIPIFFVVSGVQFDLRALLQNPSSLLLVPLFLVLFLAVRGAPALLLYRKDLGADARVPLALLSATELPLVITTTTLGTANHAMTQQVAADMVGAAMLSVLLFPAVAMALRRRQVRQPVVTPSALPQPAS